jgi:hypothetical protein
MRTAATFVLVLALAACSPSERSPDPTQVIQVVNNSNRAVIVSIGGLLDAHQNTAARPCGGILSVAISPDSYERDGRLLAMLSIDPNGLFDIALRDFTGDPGDMDGTFTTEPIWSDGTLAGRLPIHITVAPDLTVSAGEDASTPIPAACTPAY